ncbi:doubled motif LPXTG anchor domain-containing protein [Parablautia muri]|uniref:Doubled motif LPXTG anchor domain-containing protein n=1 Tax=Parablautia muri TaxID=2320879 RepID=A0A9X5BD57_9FIRM|nr:doubled motif LPXTG anchor domain-containing protein [Parablautia muri]NBJ91819.1 doubled motif LPXTG anchor domain-containing protein [Parablautia muri]
MKRKKNLFLRRRILAIFLATIMCLGEFGITAFAEGSGESPEITLDNAETADNTENAGNEETADDTETANNTDNVENEETADDTENADNTDNAENAGNVENTDDTETADNTDNAENAGNEETADDTENVDNTDNAENVGNVDDTENAENTDNAENVENTDQQISYATREELEAAYNAVVDVIDSQDKSVLNDAIDNYVSVYNRLSPEDQAEMKDQYDNVVSLRPADADSTAATLLEGSGVKEEETKLDEGKALLGQFRSLLDAMEAFVLTEENQEEYAALGMQASELLEVLLEKYYDYPGMDADMARFQALADKQTEGTEELALISKEKFTVDVVKVVNGEEKDRVTLTQQCLQNTGHSGYNHSTNLRILANASGFSGYKGYNWSPYTTVPSKYTSGLCPNNNYTSVHYNITGSAPYRANETLFLFFDTRKTFTLKYNANRGNDAPPTQTATSTDDSYDFTISTQEPTRDGYDFLGWSTNAFATSASYTGGGNINVKDTTTLYAIWTEKDTDTECKYNYKLTWDYSGGEMDGKTEKTESVTDLSNDSYTFDAGNTPTRDGFTFDGWTYTHDGIGDGTYNAGKVKMNGVADETVSGTLKAKWVPDSGITYTVTYSWGGLPEESGVTLPAEDTYEAGVPVTLDTNYPEGKELTVNGKTYTFTGWKVPDDITVDASAGGFTMPDKDVVITGKWEENLDDNNTTNTTSYRILREYRINGQTVDTIDEGERDGSIGSEIDGQTIASGNSGWVNYGGRMFVYSGSNPGTLTLVEDKNLNVIKLIYVYNDSNENPNPDPNPNPNPDPDPTPSSNPTPPERRNDTSEQRDDTPEQGDDDTPEQVPDEEQPGTNVDIEVVFTTPAAPMVNRVIELVEISNEEVPLANVPSAAAEGLTDIFDEEVPLSNVPKTGDNFLTWLLSALGSAAGLVLLALKGRKRKGTAA